MDGSLQEQGAPKEYRGPAERGVGGQGGTRGQDGVRGQGGVRGQRGGRGQGGMRGQGGGRISRRGFLGAAAGAALLGPGLPSWRRADPYVLVLGVAQDGGMPQTGCYAPRCDRARERDLPRYVCSLAIVEPDAGRYYLVDASPDLRQQMDLIDDPGFRARAQERRPFDGIFLTHGHMGHYLGLAHLGREGLGIAPTPCYCSPEMAGFLASNGPWSLLVDEGRLDLRPVEFDRWYEIDDSLSAMATPVPHRPEFSDTVGWTFRGPRRRSLLYLPDIDSWEAWDRDVAEVVRGVDVALLDGSFYSPGEVPGRNIEDIPHPMVPHTMDLLQEVARGENEVVFIHLNNTNPALEEDSAEAREIASRGFSVATEGQRFGL